MENQREILLWLKSIARKSGLIERLSFRDTSLWWFNEFPLSIFITRLTRNKQQNRGNNVSGIDIYRLRPLVAFYFLAKAILMFILGKLLMRGGSEESTGKTKIMVVSYHTLWRPHPKLGGQVRSQDVIFGDIITMLRNDDFSVVGFYEDGSLLIDFKTMIEKERMDKGLWKPIEAFLTFSMISTAYKASRRYKKEWNKLKQSPEFISSLNYKGIHLFGPLKNYLASLFEERTFRQVLLLELMEQAVEVEKPDLILVAGENLSLGKAAVIVGKRNGLPILAIQHGNINSQYPEYLHTEGEISSKISPGCCPLPDKTAVYGQWVKKVLVEDCNYPEAGVVVTGQPRYDVLARADRIFSREGFCERYGLAPDRRIALVCTENLPIFEENIVFLRAVLKALKESPEIQVVVKPHHAGKGGWHERIAREEKANALILPKRFNTYEALYACDIILAFFSTTITEALILDKPAVVVNLTGRPDPMPYVESGVALGAYREQDIQPAIKDALYDEAVRYRLAQARRRFIYEHAYLQDGQATMRVSELIKQMLASRQCMDTGMDTGGEECHQQLFLRGRA